jgi:hypothetical protein
MFAVAVAWIVAGLVCCCELPKLAYMGRLDDPYHVFPFANLSPPVRSNSRRIWLIVHLLNASALLLSLTVWSCWPAWQNDRLLWSMNVLTMLFAAMVVANSARLGSASEGSARCVNEVVAPALVVLGVMWTVEWYRGSGSVLYANVALGLLIVAPLFSLSVTIVSRLQQSRCCRAPPPTADIPTGVVVQPL